MEAARFSKQIMRRDYQGRKPGFTRLALPHAVTANFGKHPATVAVPGPKN